MREAPFCFKGFGSIFSARSFLVAVVLLAGLACQVLRAQAIYEIDLFKRSWYVQNGDSDPVPVPSVEGPFDISVEAFISQDVDPDFIAGMTMKTPGGITDAMFGPDSSFGFDYYDQYPFQAQLNTRYGPGTYRFTYSSYIDGDSIYNVPLAADAYPVAPKILNYQAGQKIDPTKDFTVQWAAFTGTGDLATAFSVREKGSSSIVFSEGPFAATQTSSTIPAGTLEAGKAYIPTVEFTRLTYTSPGGSPAVFSGFEAFTRGTLQAVGGNPPTAPTIQSIALQGDGSVQLTITCTAGMDLVIQGTPQIGGNWSALQTLTPQSSPATVTLTATDLGAMQFMRAYQ